MEMKLILALEAKLKAYQEAALMVRRDNPCLYDFGYLMGVAAGIKQSIDECHATLRQLEDKDL